MIVARRTASKALAGRAVSSLSSPLTCLKKNMPVFLGKTSDLHAVFDTETTHLSKKRHQQGRQTCTAALVRRHGPPHPQSRLYQEGQVTQTARHLARRSLSYASTNASSRQAAKESNSSQANPSLLASWICRSS